MVDTVVREEIGVGGAQVRPAPYVVGRPRWEVCEEPGLEGFAVLCKRLTNAERSALREAYDGVVDANKRWDSLSPKERANAKSPRRLEQELLAPYVLDWNAVGLLPSGEEAPLPPPAVAGPDAFECVEDDAYQWITRHVLLGYLAGGKAGAWTGG